MRTLTGGWVKDVRGYRPISERNRRARKYRAMELTNLVINN